MAPVLAATAWPSNAELIADVHRLGYVNDNDLVLDATWGRGIWWKLWCPRRLIRNDLHRDADLHYDFRRLPPEWTDWFDAAAFDPPYVSVGGRTTTGIPDLHDRYGLTDAPTSPAGVQADIDAGLVEMYRVVKPGGVVLAKCQDYISSGKMQPGTHWTLTTALALGFALVDRLEHIGAARAQPGGRRQAHARRNLSTLFVLRAPA
jgi:hypothetical protein